MSQQGGFAGTSGRKYGDIQGLGLLETVTVFNMTPIASVPECWAIFFGFYFLVGCRQQSRKGLLILRLRVEI